MEHQYLSFIIAAAKSQAAMEEHAKLLNELRKAFKQHGAAITEKMKSFPMMQQSEHQGHENEQNHDNSDGSAAAGETRLPPPPLTEEGHDNYDRTRHVA